MGAVNPSTAQAAVIVDELIAGGVTDAVLCPGSRNAPLSLALHGADAADRVSLHVRIDERTAGFLALGLGRGSGRPAVVVTTSGTAVANLHPACAGGTPRRRPAGRRPADRPPELRGVGANQVIDRAVCSVAHCGSSTSSPLPARSPVRTPDGVRWCAGRYWPPRGPGPGDQRSGQGPCN